MADTRPNRLFDVIVTVTGTGVNFPDHANFAAATRRAASSSAIDSNPASAHAAQRIITMLTVETSDERSAIVTALAIVSEALTGYASQWEQICSSEPGSAPSALGSWQNVPIASCCETGAYLCKLRHMTSVVPAGEHDEQGYRLRISRLTIDKLGVRLYDRVSAVVAELVANGHDADAENVWVELPLSTVLASKDDDGEPEDKGYEIIVRDDGHGMTPKEARDFYLKVGQDRRRTPGQGDRSRKKLRPVMGRKGIGKLAPFGICKRIEVISSGGEPVTGRGYLTTHFFLDYDQILQESDEDVLLEAGTLDGTYQEDSGTIIKLTSFLPKRVPSSDDFHRQLGVRFAFTHPDFHIHIRDTRVTPPNDSDVEQFRVETHSETFIDVSERPVITEDGEEFPVSGWVAMAKKSHKHDEGAGVRIYARGKIVATTRDFEQPAGFTGEFTMRSYLVGEIEANWLDDKEDLIRTDRQSILWDSDRGSALRAWELS